MDQVVDKIKINEISYKEKEVDQLWINVWIKFEDKQNDRQSILLLSNEQYKQQIELYKQNNHLFVQFYQYQNSIIVRKQTTEIMRRQAWDNYLFSFNEQNLVEIRRNNKFLNCTVLEVQNSNKLTLSDIYNLFLKQSQIYSQNILGSYGKNQFEYKLRGAVYNLIISTEQLAEKDTKSLSHVYRKEECVKECMEENKEKYIHSACKYTKLDVLRKCKMSDCQI